MEYDYYSIIMACLLILYIPLFVLKIISNNYHKREEKIIMETLVTREEIIKLINDGKTKSEICQQLNITPLEFNNYLSIHTLVKK